MAIGVIIIVALMVLSDAISGMAAFLLLALLMGIVLKSQQSVKEWQKYGESYFKGRNAPLNAWELWGDVKTQLGGSWIMLPDWYEPSEMKILLRNEDEDSFFLADIELSKDTTEGRYTEFKKAMVTAVILSPLDAKELKRNTSVIGTPDENMSIDRLLRGGEIKNQERIGFIPGKRPKQRIVIPEAMKKQLVEVTEGGE